MNARRPSRCESVGETNCPANSIEKPLTGGVQQVVSDVMGDTLYSDAVDSRAIAHPPVKVIMIGPLSPPYGGADVTFRRLIEAVAASGQTEPIVVATGTKCSTTPLERVASFFRSLALFLWKIKDADVVYTHLSTNGRVTLGPIVLLVSRLMGRRLIMRNIGGALDKSYETSSGITRLLLRYMLGADYVMVQTKALEKFAEDLGLQNVVVWFPNSRPIERYAHSEGTTPALRLVYLGAVSRIKGVDLLLDVARDFASSEIELTVYGSLHDITEEEIVTAHPGARYGGELTPDQVFGALANFDVLVVPSRWYNEGYTGVIIEAYAAGLAVVSVDMPTIREIAEDGETALLFELGSADSLAKCLRRLLEDRALVARLKVNALKKARLFDSKATDALFIDLCREAAGQRR